MSIIVATMPPDVPGLIFMALDYTSSIKASKGILETGTCEELSCCDGR